MAEPTGKIDLQKLIADETRRKAQAKAAADNAKRIASATSAKNSTEEASKRAALSRTVQADRLEPKITALYNQIKVDLAKVTSGNYGKDVEKSLQNLVNEYNTAIESQQLLLREAKDINEKKVIADSKGNVKANPNYAMPQSGADAAREAAAAGRSGQQPTIAAGATPSSVVAASTADEAKAGAAAGKVTPTPTTPPPKTPKTPEQVAADKAKADKAAADKAKAGGKLTAEQEARLGTFGSKFLIEYFKTAENGKYKPIYDKLVTFAIQNATGAKVEAYLRDTTWYKDVNERTYAVIGASALANGIKLDTATRDSYRDQILGKVKTAEEIAYDIRMKSIGEYQLQTTKPEVARQMMAGKDFATAVGDYINTYTTSFELAASQFSLEDANFQALFKSSTSLGDFDKKLKRSDKYLSLPKVQQAISQNVTMVKQKYRQYGLNLTDEAAANLGKNAYLGDTTSEAIDENLRQQAIKLFPAFKDRILNGESVLSIASPYIGAVSRILEVPEGSLDLEDPTIRKAMMGTTTTTGDKTSTTVKPLWEFEQELFKDSRWQYTSNARQKLDGITLDVMGRFGVIG
jgi:hypothetical protein